MNPEFSVDRFAMVVNRAPGDLELFANFFIGRATGEPSSNIEFSVGQMATDFTIQKTIQFRNIGFGTACRDGGMAIEGFL